MSLGQQIRAEAAWYRAEHERLDAELQQLTPARAPALGEAHVRRMHADHETFLQLAEEHEQHLRAHYPELIDERLRTRRACSDYRPTMKTTITAAAAAALLMLLTACGDDEPAATEENTALVDGDDVEASESAAAADVVEMGEFAELGAGVRVRVADPVVGGDDLGPWLTVQVRVENEGEEEATVPNVAIWCEGADEGGGYQADSTLALGEPVPAGSFKEGTLNLLLPGDDRTGEPVPSCEGEAFAQAEPTGMVTDEQTHGRWALPTDVVSDLTETANS